MFTTAADTQKYVILQFFILYVILQFFILNKHFDSGIDALNFALGHLKKVKFKYM